MRFPMLLAVLALLAVQSSVAQPLVVPGAILDPTAFCQSLVTNLCDDVPGLAQGSLIYMNASLDQADLTSRLATDLGLIGFSSCAAELRKFACLQYFYPCAIYDMGNALPQLVCYNACLGMQDLCSTAFQTISRQPPPCPYSDIIYDFGYIGGTNVTTLCIPLSDDNSTLPPEDMTCPLIEFWYGKKRVERLRIAATVIGYIAFVETLLVMAFTAWNPALRRWPGTLLIIMGAGQLLLALSVMMFAWGSTFNYHCNPAKKWRQLCRLQGFFLASGMHIVITTWLIMSVLTCVFVWSPNPATSVKVTYKYRYYGIALYIIPAVFIGIACAHLGNVPGSVLCAMTAPKWEESLLVWPLAAEVCLGTIAWLGSVVATVKTFGLGGANKRADLMLYARLLLYQMVATIPSATFIIPYELYRDPIRAGLSNSDAEFITSFKLWRLIVCITISAALAPLIFGTIFLLRKENFVFVKTQISSLSTGSSKSHMSGSHSGGPAAPVELNDSRF